MSVAFYSDDSDPTHRKIPASHLYVTDESVDLDDRYEIDKCVKWIEHNNFAKVALQLPDHLIKDICKVSLKLKTRTGKEIFIIGDTSCGSCCVDAVDEKYESINAIIHFGHACLSPTQRLPVLYIFEKSLIDVHDVTCNFRRLFPDVTSLIAIVYEVAYSHAIELIAENLKEYENLVVSELEIPSKESESGPKENLNGNQLEITRCRRNFVIPKSNNLDDYCIFYIGYRNVTLTNVMLSLNQCIFFTYHPLNKIAQPETLDLNKYLRKRYYYIEKTKDAQSIAILVSTLSVSKYQTIIDHLFKLIEGAGKNPYIVTFGQLTVAKLANYATFEIFVNVSCIELSIVDCHDFYQTIITPYELEVALNQAREWTGDYITDFSELLPGSAKHIPPSQIKIPESDVSLITGKMRTVEVKSDVEEHLNESTALVERDEMSMSSIHYQDAGEYLNQRFWKGLEMRLGETPVPDIQQGKKGIASEYEHERKYQNQ